MDNLTVERPPLPLEFPLTESEFVEAITWMADYEPDFRFFPKNAYECPIAVVASRVINHDRSITVTKEAVAVYRPAEDNDPPSQRIHRFWPGKTIRLDNVVVSVLERTYPTPDWATRIINRVDRFERTVVPKDVLAIVKSERAKREKV